MPLHEETDDDGQRWLSHSALEWGDYLDGASDVQVANSRELPNAVGLPVESDWLRVTRGGHGYERHWVRIDEPPSVQECDFQQPAACYGDGAEEGERYVDYLARMDAARLAARRDEWEAHVREALGSLDDYPLFNDESLSNVTEEWAEAAWDEHGRSDTLHAVGRISDDFGTWLADGTLMDWPGLNEHLRPHWNCDRWHAEGGEGGMYIETDLIAMEAVCQHLPTYAAAVADSEHEQPESVLVSMLEWTSRDRYAKQKFGSASVWREILRTVIRHNWPKWGDRPSDVESIERMSPTDANLAILADMIEERAPERGAGWPSILRAYAALPTANTGKQSAEGATA